MGHRVRPSGCSVFVTQMHLERECYSGLGMNALICHGMFSNVNVFTLWAWMPW